MCGVVKLTYGAYECLKILFLYFSTSQGISNIITGKKKNKSKECTFESFKNVNNYTLFRNSVLQSYF